MSDPQPSLLAPRPQRAPRAKPVESVPKTGVHCVERALDILRILGFNNTTGGMRFSDLLDQSDLSKATLHRLLKTLVAQGFAEQDRETRLYFLGFQFLALGASAGNRMDLRNLARPSLERLARRTGDTAYLLTRAGSDAVCLDLEPGNYPVKSLTQVIGTRRPLGKGSGPLAILAALPDSEIDNVLQRNRAKLREFPGIDLREIRSAVAQTRAHGYAEGSDRVVQGMMGMSVAILGPDDEPVGAFSVNAIRERMCGERRAQVIKWLKQEAARVAGVLRGGV